MKEIYIKVEVIFYGDQRSDEPCLSGGQYHTSLQLGRTVEPVNACFMEGESVVFDLPVRAVAKLMLGRSHYVRCKPNVPFYIMEGSEIVGEGTILKELGRKLH